MKLSASIILLLFTRALFAQSVPENFKTALMQTRGGAEIVYSSEAHSFTLDLISDKIKPLDHPNMVMVDGKIVQCILIGNSALAPGDTTIEQQKAQLLGYMQYELDYAKNDLKVNYTDPGTEWVTINGKLYLFWYYGMPKVKDARLKNTATKQVNLSSVCFAHILNLNTPFLDGDKFDDDKGELLKIAQTYKQNEFSTDFNELYKKLSGEIPKDKN